MDTPSVTPASFCATPLSKADLEKLAGCRPHGICEKEAMALASKYGLCWEVQESYKSLGSWEAALEEWDIL